MFTYKSMIYEGLLSKSEDKRLTCKGCENYGCFTSTTCQDPLMPLLSDHSLFTTQPIEGAYQLVNLPFHPPGDEEVPSTT